MSRSLLAFLSRWARRAAVASLVFALATPLAAFLAVVGWGHEVLLIVPHDPSVVALNRSLWSAGDPVAEVYGSPMSQPTRVLLWNDDEVLRPEEGESLALLPVAGPTGRPLQVQTVWWGVRIAVAGLGAAAAVLFGLAAVAKRRERSSRATAAA